MIYHWVGTNKIIRQEGEITAADEGDAITKLRKQGYDVYNVKASTPQTVDELIKQIKETKFLQPDGNPLPEWKTYYGKTWEAARKAAEKATGKRIGAMEREGAWGEAWDALKDNIDTAIWEAAREAAHNKVEKTLMDGAWEMSDDAAIYARFLIAQDLKFPNKEKHLKHVQDRWQVWQKGYAVLCDINGILYVYAKEK